MADPRPEPALTADRIATEIRRLRASVFEYGNTLGDLPLGWTATDAMLAAAADALDTLTEMRSTAGDDPAGLADVIATGCQTGGAHQSRRCASCRAADSLRLLADGSQPDRT